MHKAQLHGPVLRTRKTDRPYTHDLQRDFSERTHVYPTYVHLTLPVRFITPTELQTDTYLPTYLPASLLPCTYRVRRLGTGRLREQDYANKHEYDTNRTPHTTTYVAVRSCTGSGTHETGESQERD